MIGSLSAFVACHRYFYKKELYLFTALLKKL
ncbi:MAG: hypothetical protein ACJAWL_000839 [Motiliproteus sp.]|jgi:hypothetical protein